jgi:hypothetical protein
VSTSASQEWIIVALAIDGCERPLVTLPDRAAAERLASDLRARGTHAEVRPSDPTATTHRAQVTSIWCPFGSSLT